jgi:hypothetical protein
MGSRLTTDRAAMDRLMSHLYAFGMYFIDSRTTAETVAAEAARAAGVAHASRSVFMDNERDAAVIAKQFERAVSQARATGWAIAIGHPYRETLSVLRQRLVQLPEDVIVVPASTIAACNAL